MNSTCLKHYEMIFVMVRSCIRKITLVRVSTLVTGNPKNISDQCLRELCVSLSASSPSKFSQTSPSRKQCSGSLPHRSASGCDASAPKMKNQDIQACHFMLSINFRPPPPHTYPLHKEKLLSYYLPDKRLLLRQ